MILCDVPVERPAPFFILRPGKPRRSRKQSSLIWRPLILHLPVSSLSDDFDIVRLSSSLSHTPKIQHRGTTLPKSLSATLVIDMHIPQSLPPTKALEFASGSTLECLTPNTLINESFLPCSNPASLDLNAGDWTFVNTPNPTPRTSTPSSEPETWILIDDSKQISLSH